MNATGLEIPRIVSVDDHVVEPAHLFERWLPAKFRDAGPRSERRRMTVRFGGGLNYVTEFVDDGGTEGDVWFYEDLVLPLRRNIASAGYPREEMTLEPVTYDAMRRGCFDPVARLIPLTLVPLWDVDLAVDEVRRNAARGVRALCFSEVPAKLGFPSIHSGYWDPFFAACAVTGTVVNMHIGSSSTTTNTSNDAPAAVQITLSFNYSLISLSDYLFSGIFARFRDLKVAYSEGQTGWIPFLLQRADDVWREHRAWNGVSSAMPEAPSEYFRRNVFACFFRDPIGIELIDKVGVDNITFETDYPHTDTTWPHSKEVATEMFKDVPADVTYKLLRGNAIRMLGLDLDRDRVVGATA